MAFLIAQNYEGVKIFLKVIQMKESQDCIGMFRSLSFRATNGALTLDALIKSSDVEQFTKTVFELPTYESVVCALEEAVTGMANRVNKLSLLQALKLPNEHDKIMFYEDAASLLDACSSIGLVSRHMKTESGEVAASLYQRALQKLDSDLAVLRRDLLGLFESFPEREQSFSEINKCISVAESFAQCFGGVQPSLAHEASRIVSDSRASVFQVLGRDDQLTDEQSCQELAMFLVRLKKASRDIPCWKIEIDDCIEKRLAKRIALSPCPASFLLDLTLALRSFDGDDAIVAAQLLSDHNRFHGVLSSVFSDATSGQDITYVLKGLELPAIESEKLKKLYGSFDCEYTKFVLDGLTAFRSDEHLLTSMKEQLVDGAKAGAASASIRYEEQVVSLTARLFAHWSLSNLNDLVRAEENVLPGRLSKYLMKPHAAQVIGCWILLNSHTARDFHDLQHRLVELKTGEGKSIVLGVTASILALWGYAVDVVCYSSYLSQRDLNAFRRMFADFEVENLIWYGTIMELFEKHLGSFRERANQLIGGSSAEPLVREVYRPSVLLVDEVDVFFGHDVFGAKFGVTTHFATESLPSLFKSIWKCCTAGEAIPGDITRNCVSELPAVLRPQFTHTLRKMESHANSALQRPEGSYHVVADRIAYKYFDAVTSNLFYGYETPFLAVKEWENGNISSSSLEWYLQIRVALGASSFAEFPFRYDYILGITGTLRALAPEERSILREMYGIREYSYIPSVFGCNKLVFAGDSERGTW
jgi:hypothetical protein